MRSAFLWKRSSESFGKVACQRGRTHFTQEVETGNPGGAAALIGDRIVIPIEELEKIVKEGQRTKQAKKRAVLKRAH